MTQSTVKHTPGPWAWETRQVEGKTVALLLVTKHRPVPCNDPVIFAVREDWMGRQSPERAAARELIVAAPRLFDALEWALDQIEDSLDPDHQAALADAHALVNSLKGEQA